MSAGLKVTGGARIGWVNATWPFARLAASHDELCISGMLIGSYKFKPSEVVALEPYGSIPLIGRGIQILHSNASYPGKMIFWCFGSPERLIDRIRDLGFQPRAESTVMPKHDGMAFRWSFLITLVVAWNALFILDGFVPWGERRQPGALTLLAVGLLFFSALGVVISERFRSAVLKPGRSLSEVRSEILLTLAISAILFIGLALQHVAS